ncbi:Transcriptional regulator, TetR family [Streptomyces sp. S4.7]|uniref:TetR/AcrR family transcriptional regulator n=1 Tax=Streptomyces sp. S4.7 TaxID=2705439 RepID=UPI0013992A01|nr:TetR/AcrR family transcriptional regulator [Streptomyces sp. S4.7]QHY94429.1 Transcriptional regulator, TetR family [Streptomyces sp. S4.7]
MATEPDKVRKRGRPAADRAGLTADRILTTALALVDAAGLDALSMRRLARELGVDPMSIYHHLPNKAAVVSGLVGLVFSRMRLPESVPDDWAGQVRAWVDAYRDLTRRHPRLVLQIVTDPVAVTQASETINGPLHAALTSAGVPADKIDACAGMFVDFANGFALAGLEPPSPAPAGKPPQSHFDTGMDVMILGIRALTAGRDER